MANEILKTLNKVNETTFKKDVVLDVRKSIEVEIGDSKETKFYPQLKTKHWGNETNFSVRLLDDDYNGVVTEKGETIEWKKGSKTARMYPKEVNGGDGYEFEVQFDEKPDSNIVEFSIQTKGLRFMYQAGLDEEIVPENGEVVTPTEHYVMKGEYKLLLSTRPEDVVGSYAVYHESKKNSTVDKHYATGKAFHIYRPYAYDADGSRVWCSIVINEQDGKLTIEVPQVFLDKAAYPVIVDPTFGYTAMGASAADIDNLVIGSLFSSPAAGTVSQVSAYLAYTSTSGGCGAQNAVLGIYSSAGSLLAQGSAQSITPVDATYRLYDYAVSYSLAVDDYDLAAHGARCDGMGANRTGIAYDTGATDQGFSVTSSYSATMPSSISPTRNTQMCSIYTTYDAASIETDAVTDIGSSIATGNGEIIDNQGGEPTRRGFVYGSTTQSDPGATAPEDTSYDAVAATGQGYAPVHVQRGTATTTSGVATITLTTPVPVGKSFPIMTVRSAHTYPAYTLGNVTLQTIVDGHYTELYIQCQYTTTHQTYEWQVLSCEDFTVQSGEATYDSLSTLDIAISAVDLANTFAVIPGARNNSTGSTSTFIRASLTSTTNLQLNTSATASVNRVSWYVVSWRGATVQAGTLVLDSVASIDATITAVDLSKSFVIHSVASESFSTNQGVVMKEVSLVNSTTVRAAIYVYSASSINGRVDWFVVSHPILSVQAGTVSSSGTSYTATPSAVDVDRTFIPSSNVGNARVNKNANGFLEHGYSTLQLTNSTTVTIQRGAADALHETYWQTVEDTLPIYAEETFSIVMSGLEPETTYYARAFMYTDGSYFYGDEVSFTTTASSGAQPGSAISILLEM